MWTRGARHRVVRCCEECGAHSERPIRPCLEHCGAGEEVVADGWMGKAEERGTCLTARLLMLAAGGAGLCSWLSCSLLQTGDDGCGVGLGSGFGDASRLGLEVCRADPGRPDGADGGRFGLMI